MTPETLATREKRKQAAYHIERAAAELSAVNEIVKGEASALSITVELMTDAIIARLDEAFDLLAVPDRRPGERRASQ